MRSPKRQPNTDEDATRIVQSWIMRSDTEAALVAGTYVEDRLGFAIKSRFVDLPAKGNVDKVVTEASLFEGYGPLSSFYTKIDIGYALM